jgi:hypothetical protein
MFGERKTKPEGGLITITMGVAIAEPMVGKYMSV